MVKFPPRSTRANVWRSPTAYDSCFYEWTPYNYVWKKFESNFSLLNHLFKYADQLPIFIVYALHVSFMKFIRSSDLWERIIGEIWQKIPALSQGEPVPEFHRFDILLCRN